MTILLAFLFLLLAQSTDNQTSQGNKNVRIVMVEVGDDQSAAVTVFVTPFERDQELTVWLYRLVAGRVQYNHTDESLAGHRGIVDKAGADGTEAHPAPREVWTGLTPGPYLAAAFLTRVGPDGPMELPSNKVAFDVLPAEKQVPAPGVKAQ